MGKGKKLTTFGSPKKKKGKKLDTFKTKPGSSFQKSLGKQKKKKKKWEGGF